MTDDRAPEVVLATSRRGRPADDDLDPLLTALGRSDLRATAIDWDAAFDWHEPALVVIRSTWDYHERPNEFLAWADRVGEATTLANPPEVVRWNHDKRYLLELEAIGIPIIPTSDLEPDATDAAVKDAVALAARVADGVVVKPAISAGSRNTTRSGSGTAGRHAAVEHVRRLHRMGMVALVQPFVESVDTRGETAMIHIDGAFSHSVAKGPVLVPGSAPRSDRAAIERLEPRTASDDERQLAELVQREIESRFGPLLYARIDVVETPWGPVVLEVELIEPALFLAHAEHGRERFAAAIAHRCPR